MYVHDSTNTTAGRRVVFMLPADEWADAFDVPMAR
jgi:hypothetical protein